ncbi:MAG TPA: arsenate reductase, partial [Candidatus Poseidoniales archaeon]
MRVYHNPRCSKSRQAITLLTEAGFDFEEYRYLSEGVDADDAKILSSLPNIVRKKDVLGDV